MKKPHPTTWKILRNRIIAGLFVVLPLFITYYVINWLYVTLNDILIGPISTWLLLRWFPGRGDLPREDLPAWLEYFAAPAAALGLVIAVLFIAGMFFRSRIHRLVDWFLNNVPGVNLIYSVVSNVFEAVQRSQFGTDQFKRVVLVKFPHPGMKVPAFVTSETMEENTGEVILCVYVPTTPVPTSGYMLMVPESEVVTLDWDLQETLQTIVSGGITAPPTVRYYSLESLASLKKTIPNKNQSQE